MSVGVCEGIELLLSMQTHFNAICITFVPVVSGLYYVLRVEIVELKQQVVKEFSCVQ